MLRIAAMIFVLVAIVGILFGHAIGPALYILAVTPFEGILFTLFGPPGNYLTPIPVLILLARTPNKFWGQIFLGTRIQVVAAAFVVILVIPHMMSVSEFGYRSFAEYLIRALVFALMCLVAWSLKDERTFELGMRVMIGSIAIITVIGLMDFFFGTSILPTVEAEQYAGQGAAEVEFAEHRKGKLRFAIGGSQNRSGTWMQMPAFLALGWIVYARTQRSRLIAFGLFSITMFGLIATISRSNYLGFGLGILLLTPTLLRANPRLVVNMFVVGAVVLTASLLLLLQTGTGEAIFARLTTAEVGRTGTRRMALVQAALLAFFDSPLFGHGSGMARTAIAPYAFQPGLTTHNTYTHLLVETGLLGFVPWMTMIILSLRQLSRRCVEAAGGLEKWRPFVRSAMVAILVQGWFNDSAYERYLWFCVAFAVVCERYEAQAAARAMRERYAASLPGSASEPDFGPAAPGEASARSS